MKEPCSGIDSKQIQKRSKSVKVFEQRDSPPVQGLRLRWVWMVHTELTVVKFHTR